MLRTEAAFRGAGPVGERQVAELQRRRGVASVGTHHARQSGSILWEETSYRQKDVRVSAIRLVDVDGAGDAVERDVLGHHIRDETCHKYAGTHAHETKGQLETQRNHESRGSTHRRLRLRRWGGRR